VEAEKKKRLFIKVKRDNLPQVKDKYPFLYLERGRLEIDDSSVKWIDSEGSVVRLPCAVINCLLLGPGVSITHEAVKVLAAANCAVCWVGEDSLLFYAAGLSPTADTRNLRRQMHLAHDPQKALAVARRFFLKRFPEDDVKDKTLAQLRGMEGKRVKACYARYAEKYGVGWQGRSYRPGQFELSDLTNQILTACNAALYGVLNACIISMGYSPHIGYIHSGSPLPFTYDLADLYKEDVCIDTAFHLTFELAGEYNKYRVSDEFRQKIVQCNILGKVGGDIAYLLGDE
jgi:CRISPR-associated protein Cas1